MKQTSELEKELHWKIIEAIHATGLDFHDLDKYKAIPTLTRPS